MSSPTLKVEHISKSYRGKQATVHALRELSFEIQPARSLAIVGESGCGKTTAAYCIAGLHPVDAGTVYLGGENFSAATGAVQKRLRSGFGMVFQNPLAALNPRMQIWQSVAEPLRVHAPSLPKQARLESAQAILAQVGLSSLHFHAFPAALSGGQLQRVVLARALIMNPRLVILDEPTSALDVSIQAQVLNLLQDLRETRALSYLFITHNLALVEVLADDVLVMYAGRVVEAGPVGVVFARPRHPYTQELINTIPDPSPRNRQNFRHIDVRQASQSAASGCAYRLRCSRVQADCALTVPTIAGQAHAVACLHPLDE